MTFLNFMFLITESPLSPVSPVCGCVCVKAVVFPPRCRCGELGSVVGTALCALSLLLRMLAAFSFFFLLSQV